VTPCFGGKAPASAAFDFSMKAGTRLRPHKLLAQVSVSGFPDSRDALLKLGEAREALLLRMYASMLSKAQRFMTSCIVAQGVSGIGTK